MGVSVSHDVTADYALKKLNMTEVKETGRYFSGWFFSPFLKTGATLAVFQPFEITP